MSISTVARERVLVLGIAITCGCLAVWACGLLYSDLAMSYPRAVMTGWERGDAMPNNQGQRRLLQRMGRAIAVNPFSAEQRMDVGRFFVWHAARQQIGSPRAEFYHRLAADRFAEAVIARPTWGYAWALLAEQWQASGQAPARIAHALDRAIQLSPREPGVQLKSLWLGLNLWDGLAQATQQQLLGAMHRLVAQREYFDQAVGIVLHYHRHDLLQNVLRHEWQKAAMTRLQQRPGTS